jgi:hypothetical protein
VAAVAAGAASTLSPPMPSFARILLKNPMVRSFGDLWKGTTLPSCGIALFWPISVFNVVQIKGGLGIYELPRLVLRKNGIRFCIDASTTCIGLKEKGDLALQDLAPSFVATAP